MVVVGSRREDHSRLLPSAPSQPPTSDSSSSLPKKTTSLLPSTSNHHHGRLQLRVCLPVPHRPVRPRRRRRGCGQRHRHDERRHDGGGGQGRRRRAQDLCRLCGREEDLHLPRLCCFQLNTVGCQKPGAASPVAVRSPERGGTSGPRRWRQLGPTRRELTTSQPRRRHHPTDLLRVRRQRLQLRVGQLKRERDAPVNSPGGL
mmetsp:Transcript_22341/g.56168  ORF Transcript_22341/g.56168 Transcript_22341/m.56168 type:complete len:202 (+) Transcript_22341:19-624(+)